MGNSNSIRKNTITQYDINNLKGQRVRFIHKERKKFKDTIAVFTYSPAYVARSVKIQGSYFQIQHLIDKFIQNNEGKSEDDKDWDFALSGESEPHFLPKDNSHKDVNIVGTVKDINILRNEKIYIIKIILENIGNNNQEIEFKISVNNEPFRHTENFKIGLMMNSAD